jgi:nucleotide-binding universal stress UspA family protein
LQIILEVPAMLQDLKKILTPVDFSDYSMSSMRQGFELAKETGAELHLLHVVAPHHVPVPGERAREVARETSLLEQAEEELERLKKDHLGNSSKVSFIARIGHPVTTIAEYARDQKIDLIVMATHGRTGFEHLLIGSVTEKLVRSSPCSVLVVRAKT